ncbi:glutaminyl-peptide cyclotransferase-like isoform X2 [Montipora foliosa]|uniref:glutaminyl-peptide cyclotransferase-like isoform X2 n=1 Tax=Montipora foliosa TaxID=591990 RepID=UPI0035F102B1
MKLTVVLILVFFEIVSLRRTDTKRLSDHPLKRTLAESKLNDLAQRTDYQSFYYDIFRPILRVRVPGTNGHHKVKMFIKKNFEDLDWTVSLDEFDDNTPYGPKRFTNIIATLNPNAKRRLILAAHYDSKYFPENSNGYFLGATDSAMPCAMLIEIAKVVTPLFAARKQQLQMNRKNGAFDDDDNDDDDEQSDVTLQMVFFDGEEAFVEWTSTDSLYGSRHLADIWYNQSHPPGSTNSTMLSTINAMVLLDLIGSQGVSFFNTFNETNDLFERLEVIERRLMSTNHIEDRTHTRPYFVHGLMNGAFRVEDDHIPFYEKGVKILHLISLPFPSCWHKPCDDEPAISGRVVKDLLKILQVFVVEYFALTVE